MIAGSEYAVCFELVPQTTLEKGVEGEEVTLEKTPLRFSGFVVRLLRAFFALPDVRAFWDMKGPIVLATSTLDSNEGRTSAEGDMVGAAAVFPFLYFRFGQQSVWEGTSGSYLTYYGEEYLDKFDLVLIGGPISNTLTEKVLSKLDLRHKVEGHAFIDTVTGQRFEKDGDHDYGLIIKAKSPYNPSRRLVVLMGTRALGTTIASCLASNIEFLRWIRKRFGQGECEILIRGHLAPNKNPWPVAGGIIANQPLPFLTVHPLAKGFLSYAKVSSYFLIGISLILLGASVLTDLGTSPYVSLYAALCSASFFYICKIGNAYLSDEADNQ